MGELSNYITDAKFSIECNYEELCSLVLPEDLSFLIFEKLSSDIEYTLLMANRFKVGEMEQDPSRG